MLAFFVGTANEAWAADLTKGNIVIEGGAKVGETFEYTIDNGSVTVKEIDNTTRTVTITVTPASGYFVNKSDIIVQKLIDPSSSEARRRAPGIADALTVTGPSSSSVATDYTFVVPTDYAGALVTITFTAKSPATAAVKPNSLTYTDSPQPLITLGTVIGGAATDPVTYSLSIDGTYSATIPTGTDAGTYTVYYKVAADAIHTEGSGSVNVTIGKARITSVELDNYAINDDGSSHTVHVTSVKAESLVVPSDNYTVSGNTASLVGIYTVTVTVKPESVNFTGSATANFRIVETTTKIIYSNTTASEVTELNGHYLLMDNIGASVLANLYSTTEDFTGTFEVGCDENGDFYKIDMTNYSHALFNTINGGTVKNVILDNVVISSGNNVGAICNEATGDSRIYNCGVLATNSEIETDEDGYTHITASSSTISGSSYVGSIVGLLDGSSRVINCFSYANVSGGSYVGGIVGYNNVATTANNLKTMVMNCMFYGEVSGSSIAPIYNGEIITNDGDANGVNNFNYFLLESSYINDTGITKVYNCALGAETRFLQRFEFYRYLLNSNRELAAWWVKGNDGKKSDMAKWVLEPGQIGSTVPFPILKTPDKYYSVVNYDADHAEAIDAKNEHRNEGRKLTNEGADGVLHVTIQMGAGGAVYTAPSGAGFKSGETGKFDLTITDKDFEHFNYNYGKVQLPYYNDYCNGNYTENCVVTGWKIVSITGGTAGNYTTYNSDEPADVTYDKNGNLTATPYNFADRNCTNKDLYGDDGSNRVFNQGAYWDVPDGVTAITIEPYWGKAVYLSDASWDVVYQNGTEEGIGKEKASDAMVTAANVPNVGGVRNTTFNGQTVYTSLGDAIASSGSTGLFGGINENTRKKHSVYDYAVVLVGNYHHNANTTSGIGIEAGEGKPYTITSVDNDGDNEPDYSLILRFNDRTLFHPVRYDFLNLIGLGMAQKTTGGTGSYNLGIMQPKYWFEMTNTALFRVTQFEYSPAKRVKKPIILQGGVVEQWVTQQQNAGDAVEYFHVGGNVWFKEFHRGSHQDNPDRSTPHPPVSVTGGDFDKFYLTGLYQSQATIVDDNAECYINGGRFGEMAGAGMEGIGISEGKGNVTWVIDHADIKEFYGGGINFAKPVHGNIHTIISNSHVDQFCGGPKFGNMENGRTVTTTATNCTFGTYFGAGYGGNSYNRYAPTNRNNVINLPTTTGGSNHNSSFNSWNQWVASDYTQSYNATYKGVSTQIDYQFIPMSSNVENVARLWVEFIDFSLATCHNVTSSLTGCKITGNFYGGGSLGKVNGDVNSTLTNCKVDGNVFGAGYSASLPTIEVMNLGGFQTEPYYYEDLGTYRKGVFPATTTYHWEHKNTISSTSDAIKTTAQDHILYTTVNLDKSNLGSVQGNVNLTIQTEAGKTTTIGTEDDNDTGNVFGGGEESYVTNTPATQDTPAAINTVTVNIKGPGNTHILGNVFGGGDKGEVEGSTVVKIED